MSEAFEFWGPVQVNGPTVIMSAPEQIAELLDFFSKHSIANRVKIANVQE